MYPFDSVYKQERTLYTFHQNDLKKYQWYENFNTQSDVINDIRGTRQHKVLLEHVDKEKHSDYFENITVEEQKIVRLDAEERYLAYVLLQHSGR